VSLRYDKTLFFGGGCAYEAHTKRGVARTARALHKLMAMDPLTLVAKLRTLSDAGSSYVEQAQCCFDLQQNATPMPTAAAADDAAHAVITALSRGVQDSNLQMAGCYALASLISETPATGVTAGAAGITAVLAALRTRVDDSRVQASACGALAVLAAFDATNRATAGAAGGVATVVAAMTRHSADAEVVLHGCTALGKLTQNDLQNAVTALDAGAATVALAAMRAFPAADLVQAAGCCALSGIVAAAGNLGSARNESSAVDAAVAAMLAHAGDSALQIQGCSLLLHLFRDERNGDAALARRAGAVLTVVTAALRAHQHDVDVLNMGCMAIVQLVACTQGITTCATGVSNAVKAVVAVLRAFPAVAELQQAGLLALAATCLHVHDNNLAAAGGLEVAVSALRTYTTDMTMNMTVQHCACMALGALVAGAPPSQTRTGKLGGVEAMAAVLCARCAVQQLPAERDEYFRHWCQTMAGLLRDHPVNTQKAVASDSIELVVSVMNAPDATPDVFESACIVLTFLTRGADPEARAVTAGALEALQAQTVQRSAVVDASRVEVIQRLQAAAQRHDADPCVIAGCQRCAAARARGSMCALPGCGARSRDGGAKKLLRCGTCRAACYCGPAHQREDWGRHKGACGAQAHEDAHAGGASGS
jgi:hypothetical protein